MSTDVAPTAAIADEVGVGIRVRVHPGLCEGWGNCHRFAPTVYPLDAEGYIDLHLLEVPAQLADAGRLGAEVCPARAITIIEERGSQP